MRWKGREKSTNVEDRRGMSSGKKVAGGTIGTLVIVLIVWLLGGNPSAVINQLQVESPSEAAPASYSQEEEELVAFVSVVLKDTEDIWKRLFSQINDRYREPKLVLFSSAVESACGYNSAATGPFYCPADEKVYIDLNFLVQLQERLGATGDFAMAYIIAHEVGHHVQKLLGIMDDFHRNNANVSKETYNSNMVRLELQADFLAGIWAHHAQRTKNILEPGDVDEAVNAAAMVGDDRLQMKSQGYVVPDAFTHGTSEQRSRWFLKGFQTGDLGQGDTFSAREL
ncbi:MAG TPA: neutral zinc metallopeptidase [Bacteroidales bacterium]|nr:neutral zinc metallopeptidase [Bacteroidales bacterium]